ncbi:unnamed protein product [Gemmataceae bacterium]|jgi:hypothetical protein|nr:unnamed protein product [Gemmataceae bacterium]VTU01821.1 unnamed protein product [Gemmataceae bacterium]
MRTVFCAALCAAALGPVGCSGGAKLGPVSGSVTLDGQPVTAGVVTFVAADRSNTASAEITPEGTYSIPDAPTGEVVICVKTRDHEFILGPGSGPPPDPAAGSGGVKTTQKKNPLFVRTPEKYEDATRTDLRATVPATGAPTTFDVKMTK